MFVSIICSNLDNVAWVVNMAGIKPWSCDGSKKFDGFSCDSSNGCEIHKNGKIVNDFLQFAWKSHDVEFKSFNTLEEAKQHCFEYLGYKPEPTVKDMKDGDIFKIKSTGQICAKRPGHLVCINEDNNMLSIPSRLDYVVERLKIVPDVS